jgi:hypothetical protein
MSVAPAIPPARKTVLLAPLAVGCCGLLTFALVGYYGYQYYLHGPETEEEMVDDTETPAELQDLAKAIAEAQKKMDQELQKQKEAAPPPKAAPVVAPVVQTPTQKQPSAPAPTPTKAPTKSPTPAPQPIADRPAVPADSPDNPAPVASAEFKAWVNNLKISGVAQRAGSLPRILIGGASFNQGDVVAAEMGVTFDHWDPVRRMVRFRDKSGATVERRDR